MPVFIAVPRKDDGFVYNVKGVDPHLVVYEKLVQYQTKIPITSLAKENDEDGRPPLVTFSMDDYPPKGGGSKPYTNLVNLIVSDYIKPDVTDVLNKVDFGDDEVDDL